MNDDFEKQQRDPFVTEEGAAAKIDRLRDFLDDPDFEVIINDKNHDLDHRGVVSSALVSDRLELLILNYSIGQPIVDLIPLAKEAFFARERDYKMFNKQTGSIFLWETNGYMQLMWLMGLAVMLDQNSYIPKIASWINHDPANGNDPLVSKLFSRMGVSGVPMGDVLIHTKGYSDLYKVVTASESDVNNGQRELWMESHLKNWYKNAMKPTIWGDWHEQPKIHFGYWSFESGLVTLLYGLDDSSYRDMTFYPKDLVDWARENVDLRKLQPLTVTPKSRYTGYAVTVGEICQETGHYECPRLQGRIVMLMQGQKVLGEKHNEMGAIIWYKLTKEAERDYLENRKKNPLTGNWE